MTCVYLKTRRSLNRACLRLAVASDCSTAVRATASKLREFVLCRGVLLRHFFIGYIHLPSLIPSANHTLLIFLRYSHKADTDIRLHVSVCVEARRRSSVSAFLSCSKEPTGAMHYPSPLSYISLRERKRAHLKSVSGIFDRSERKPENEAQAAFETTRRKPKRRWSVSDSGAAGTT